MKLVRQIEWCDRQAGDIGAYHGGELISDAIEDAEKFAGEASWASHIFVVRSRELYLEAAWPRVRLAPANEYPLDRIRLFRIIAATGFARADAAVGMELDYLGRRYDAIGVFAFAWIELWRRFGYDVPDYLASGRRRWCSEIGAACANLQLYSACQLPPFKPSETDPANLYGWLLNASR